MTNSDSRLRQQCSKLYNIVVGVLSLAPCYVRKKQVRDKGVPSSYHSKWWSVFVEWWLHHCSPLPCKCEIKTKEVLHLFRCYTHTRTHTTTTVFGKPFIQQTNIPYGINHKHNISQKHIVTIQNSKSQQQNTPLTYILTLTPNMNRKQSQQRSIIRLHSHRYFDKWYI